VVLKILDVLVTIAQVEAVGQVVGHGVGHNVGQLVLWVVVTVVVVGGKKISVVVVTVDGEHEVGSVGHEDGNVGHEWDLECEPEYGPEWQYSMVVVKFPEKDMSKVQ
jgi:hypothetical protein